MGNWNITIRGTGCHHNKNLPIDANRMAAAFVQALRDAGHTVSHASITYGGENDLTAPKVYLDDQDAIDGAEPRKPRCGKDLGPQVGGNCDATKGSPFKFCPDPECPVHGEGAPHVACRLVEDHEGKCCPPFVVTKC